MSKLGNALDNILMALVLLIALGALFIVASVIIDILVSAG